MNGKYPWFGIVPISNFCVIKLLSTGIANQETPTSRSALHIDPSITDNGFSMFACHYSFKDKPKVKPSLTL